MVDTSQQLEQLKQAEAQQQRVLSTPIPERVFGAGIDISKQQEQVIAAKQQAQQNLVQIQQQQKILQQQQGIEQQQSDYAKGVQLAKNNPDIPSNYLPSAAYRQGYLDYLDQEKQAIQNAQYSKQLRESQQQAPVGYQGYTTKEGVIFKPIPVPQGYQGYSTAEGIVFKPVPQIITQPTQEQKGFLAEQIKSLQELQKTGSLTNTEKVFAGASLGFYQNIYGAKQLFTSQEARSQIVQSGKNLLFSPIQTVSKFAKGEFIQFKSDPFFYGGEIAGNLIFMKGVGKGINLAGKGIEFARFRLSPSYRAIEETPLGKVIKGVPSIDKELKTIDIPFSKPVSKITIPLKEQVYLAGKEITAVSAQTSLFGKVFNQEVKILKPIPGQAELPTSTQNLLKNFPESPAVKEILNLQPVLNQAGSIGLIERSFFADPFGRLRVSRLRDVQPEASIFDILKGDFTFKKGRPQALVFEKQTVEQFPSNLKDVALKLSKGGQLTQLEEARLLEFQLKPSGKFKPIGKITREPEVTISPGDIIVKEKTIGKTLIFGKGVEIVRTSIKGAEKRTSELLSKGELTLTESKELGSRLLKETGLSSSSLGIKQKPFLSLPKAFAQTLSYELPSYTSKIEYRPNSISGLSKQSVYPKGISPATFYPGLTSPKVQTASPAPSYSNILYKELPAAKAVYPPVKTKEVEIRPLIRLPSNEEYKRKKKLSQAYKVQVRRFGKFQTISSDLPRGKAIQLGTSRVLNTLGATFRLQKGGTTEMQDVDSFINPNVFRTPKKGGKLDLPETYIQRSGSRKEGGQKGGRLASFGERREIQLSKHTKRGLQ